MFSSRNAHGTLICYTRSQTTAVKLFCSLRVWTDFADFEIADNLLNLKILGDLLFYRE